MNLQKTYLAEFYCLEDHEITLELVEADKGGSRRAALLALEAQLYPEVAQERDIKGLERQVSWGKRLCAWDVGTASLRQLIRQKLGLLNFLDPAREWTADDLKACADLARRCRNQIKITLNFTSSAAVSDTQIVHQLLAQMGVKVEFRWSRTVPGHEGEKLKVHRLCSQAWAAAMEILDRRAARRSRMSDPDTAGSPSPSVSTYKSGGDPMLESNPADSGVAGRSPWANLTAFTSAISLEALPLSATEDAWVAEDDDSDFDD